MSFSSPFRNIAVLGPGLLGGSVSLAVKKYLTDCEVVLWGRREEPLALARVKEAADDYTTDLARAVSQADLIIIASPVGVMKSLAESFAPHVKPGVLVTDVGSVKGCVHRDLGNWLTTQSIPFVGSHPMAGSEKQGIKYANADLLMGACVVLTNGEDVQQSLVDDLNRFWVFLGARCLELGADEHDRVVARVSHMPHAIAALCVQSAGAGIDLPLLSKVAATGFRDTSRVAEGAPDMWAEILLENRESVITSLNEVQRQLQLLHEMLASKDKFRLCEWLAEAKEFREEIMKGVANAARP